MTDNRRRDPAEFSWRQATASEGGGAQVQVAAVAGEVMVRDSADPAGPVLAVAAGRWRSFLDGVRRGEFDIPRSAPDLPGADV